MRDNPRICIYDEDIAKFTGKKVGNITVGEEITMTVRCKVTGVDVHERDDWGPEAQVATTAAKGEPNEPKKVKEERLELDVVGGGEEKKPERVLTYRSGRF